MDDIVVRDDDRLIWQRELDDFVPPRIFDAHGHIYDSRFLSESDLAGHALVRQYPKVALSDLQRHTALLFPGREAHFLVTGFPMPQCDTLSMDRFVAGELKADRQSIGLMLVRPDFTPAQIEQHLDATGLRGFKPYMAFSRNPDRAQSTVLEMLPEHYWRIAHERGLIVLLHMGRRDALADPVNQREIRQWAERYPRVKLQLAHCARCFTPQIAEAGLPTVADLPNVHVDVSAVCEQEVFHILLDVWPRARILFGTDNSPAGIARGKYISCGRGWFGVDEGNTTAFDARHVSYRPTFVAYENLRCMKYAARRKGWGRPEIEDFFLNNARRLLTA